MAPPPPQPSGTRARRREATEADILRVAREHLARHGAAALSLRAVARDLGMVSSGIYRYVPSRDDLLTRLIVDSYRSLSDAVHLEHDRVVAVDPADLDGRWAAIGLSVRRWSLARPHDFALLYGSPVPDYEAPPDRTVGPGTEVLALVLRLLQDAHEQGRLAGTDAPGPDTTDALSAVGPMLSEPFFDGLTVGPVGVARGLTAWTLLLGAVTSEVFGQLGAVPDPEALFRVQLVAARSFILVPPQ